MGMSYSTNQLQADLFARIMSEGYFSDIVGVLNDEGVSAADLENTFKFQLNKAGKKGAAVVVDEIVRDVDTPNPMGPNFRMILPVGIYVHPTVNFGDGGTNKRIEDITDELCNRVHGWKPHPRVGQIHASATAVTPVLDLKGLKVREVQFTTSFGLEKPTRVAMPTISGNADACSIFCNTAGAVIYYTLDGSAPWEGNTEAEIYGYALQTESGIIITTEEGNELTVANPLSGVESIRAGAYLTDTHQGSDWAYAEF
jgi:hypothetical protein